jgi:SOS-response transcriptional repressor LexA
MDRKPTKKGLLRRLRILAWIQDYIRMFQYSPTVRDIATGVNLRSTGAVAVHLKRMEEEGWITRSDNKKRTTRLTQFGREQVYEYYRLKEHIGGNDEKEA